MPVPRKAKVSLDCGIDRLKTRCEASAECFPDNGVQHGMRGKRPAGYPYCKRSPPRKSCWRKGAPPPELPVVVVENCSRVNERILHLQLNELERGLAGCSGPVLVMIGEALAPRK